VIEPVARSSESLNQAPAAQARAETARMAGRRRGFRFAPPKVHVAEADAVPAPTEAAEEHT
jgi:hypothetical protein